MEAMEAKNMTESESEENSEVLNEKYKKKKICAKIEKPFITEIEEWFAILEAAIKKSEKVIAKSQKAIAKSQKAIAKSQKAIEKYQKAIEKTLKAIEKNQKAIAKSKEKRAKLRKTITKINRDSIKCQNRVSSHYS